MRKTFVLLALLCLAPFGTGRILAQSTGSGERSQSPAQSVQSKTVPRILWIYREEVKPARGASHEKVEARYARLWEKAGVQPYLSLDAVSGDADETIFISGYSSFAAFGKDYRTFSAASSGPLKSDYDALTAQEAGLLNGVHSAIAVYRPDLSYLSEGFMERLPKSRYMEIESFHVRFGKDDSFAEGAKAYQDAYRELNIEDPWVVYQVTSGAQEGTNLVFASMESLSDMDRHMARRSQIEQIANAKMGDMMKHAEDAFSSVQTNIYRLNPKTSYVSDEFASADPSFWRQSRSSSGEIQSLARADFSTDPAVIRRVQDALRTLGYYAGVSDGIAGKQTRSALRHFQEANNLPVTGIIDRDTAYKLGFWR